MRKLSTLLLLCAIGMPLNAATTVRVKTKLPEGVELHGDVVLRYWRVQKVGYESVDIGFVNFPPAESRRLPITP